MNKMLRKRQESKVTVKIFGLSFWINRDTINGDKISLKNDQTLGGKLRFLFWLCKSDLSKDVEWAVVYTSLELSREVVI